MEMLIVGAGAAVVFLIVRGIGRALGIWPGEKRRQEAAAAQLETWRQNRIQSEAQEQIDREAAVQALRDGQTRP